MDQIQIENHRGIIASVVIRWWPKLPAYYQVFYAVDDMLGDAIIHAVRKAPQYRKDHASPATWLHAITKNYCYQVVEAANQKSRYHYREDLEEFRVANNACAAPSHARMAQAIEAVETLIQYASPSLKRFISVRLLGNPGRLSLDKYERQALIAEWQRLARLLHVNRVDFELVLARA